MGDVIKQPPIWKFVGRVSAITGVVCFGLSSTYDMSFGKLGYGGPLVYLFVCSFMWWLMIWGKRIQVSEKFMIWGKRIQVSEKFNGVVGAILFVVICSISVVYKKYVPEKSDAYTITSYGSFALMSVSLSRKFELGFETGVSAFFLKLFAARLLQIKWFLLPIALVFCSLVIILRHYPEFRGYWIELVLIEGRNFTVMGQWGARPSGLSVTVSYGNMEKQAESKQGTINPKWNQTFEFLDDGSPLSLHFKDTAAFREYSIAYSSTCVVEYQQLPLNQMDDRWLYLEGNLSGEIHIQITRKVLEMQKRPSLDAEPSLIPTQIKEMKVTQQKPLPGKRNMAKRKVKFHQTSED